MEKKPNKKRRISPSITAAIGALITIVGGFFLSYNYIQAKSKFVITDLFKYCSTNEKSDYIF